MSSSSATPPVATDRVEAPSANLARMLVIALLALTGLVAMLLYNHGKEVRQLESVISATRLAAQKMRLFSEQMELARSRTRLTNQIIDIDDAFEQDSINLQLDAYATRFAIIVNTVSELPATPEEETIHAQQRKIPPIILPKQREIVELAMRGDPESRAEARRQFYEVVLPGQDTLIELFGQLVDMQQKRIDTLVAEAEAAKVDIDRHQFQLVVLSGILALGISIFVVRRTHLIQNALQESHATLERTVEERTTDLMLARDLAERANRAKSEFLSSMSHELRTPMNAILGFAQILECEEDLDDGHRESVREIRKAGDHLLELINEVLDLAKIESGRMEMSIEPVHLGELSAECFTLIRPLAQKRGISATNVLADSQVMVLADRTRLKQVMLNLLSNGVKYNHEHGALYLELRPNGQAGTVSIQVRDTGPGIPNNRMDELFQPFNRLGAEGSNIEGTGIGLTISQRIINMMGGQLCVESSVGVGSKFWIELPAADGVATSAAPGRPPAGATTPEAVEQADLAYPRRKLLYIEDNPVNLKLLRHLLGQHPEIEYLEAHTPELGIQLALVHQPDLILLDINMPGMDGYEVMAHLRSHPDFKPVPIVAFTANAMQRDIERGREAGFDDYLTKPLDVRSFKARIAHWLETGSIAAQSK